MAASFERNAGIRIDHLLVNKAARKRLMAAEVDPRPRHWEKTSDHAPVCIELGEVPTNPKRKNQKDTAK